ncbi:MAG: TIGR04282 family arsenosugar biosynthesis glycosyltransferase [Desulfurivibrionaceae bacterium]|nr:TIGR04282 family arsenosugar biosynthesis glycosyltransferase [Desulfobulbales bacterium]MDT8335856.1 TIGR04282 family arsenosugar biosynthesis glycosyltransferase [Desulfurivibrionaceae bacterium]
MKKKLIIFTRYPEAGRVKTRLIPALGPLGAAGLQQRMTEDTLRIAEEAAAENRLDLEIRYVGGDPGRMADWLGTHRSYCGQGSGDLGEKMTRAFADAFQNHYHQVMLIGADCPALTPRTLADGFAVLLEHELVLGPASDGGYYLIGLTRPCPELFRRQPWGGNVLLSATIVAARKLGLKLYLLEELADVDRPEDLENFGDHPDPE